MGAASVLLGERIVSPASLYQVPNCSAAPDQLKLVQIVFRCDRRAYQTLYNEHDAPFAAP